MGRFSKLERETQDALVREELAEKEALKKQETASVPEEEYDAAYYLEEADRAYFSGNYKQALQLYSRAAQMDTTQHYAWIGQIYSMIEMGQWKDADLWVGRALELFPEDPALLSLRAMSYAKRGMYKRALNTTDYAMTRKGADVHTSIVRGFVLLEADNSNANFCFMKAMETARESDWKTPMRIGLIYLKKKKYSPALEYFNKACAINTTNPYLWYHKGYCCEKLGLGNKALSAYQHAVDLDPEYKTAKNALARVSHSSFLVRLFRRIFNR